MQSSESGIIITKNEGVRWLIALVVTIIICVAGSAPVFVTSLFVPGTITYPFGRIAFWIDRGMNT